MLHFNELLPFLHKYAVQTGGSVATYGGIVYFTSSAGRDFEFMPSNHPSPGCWAFARRNCGPVLALACPQDVQYAIMFIEDVTPGDAELADTLRFIQQLPDTVATVDHLAGIYCDEGLPEQVRRAAMSKQETVLAVLSR